MSFGIRCNFSPIQSYAQAVEAWQHAVVFPEFRRFDSPLAQRGLVDRRKKHLSIQRTEAEDIILRLYGKPIVTWHKDGALTIRAHHTKSTVMFANHCTPAGMFVGGGNYFRVTVDGRTYKVKHEITFRRHGNTWKADKIEPWSVPVINRERAKQALDETGYKDFRAWLIVYVQMAPQPDNLHPWCDSEKIIDLLRDRSTWRELAALLPYAWNHPERALETVRSAIYRKHDCIEQKSVPFLG